MGPLEAFQKLGYTLKSRYDWSAEKHDGVCITLWEAEYEDVEGTSTLDTRINSDPIEEWRFKRGNKLRISLLKRACVEFGGAIDVVVREGTSKNNNGQADPWDERKRGMGWQVDWFDPETGHFKVSASRQII